MMISRVEISRSQQLPIFQCLLPSVSSKWTIRHLPFIVYSPILQFNSSTQCQYYYLLLLQGLSNWAFWRKFAYFSLIDLWRVMWWSLPIKLGIFRKSSVNDSVYPLLTLPTWYQHRSDNPYRTANQIKSTLRISCRAELKKTSWTGVLTKLNKCFTSSVIKRENIYICLCW